MKASIKLASIVSACFLGLSFLAAPVSAVPARDVNNQNNNTSNTSDTSNTTKASNSPAAFTGNCRSGFLGLTSWDCDVDIHDEDSLKAGIWQIVANIATDITVIAAYLVLGYVIYGGYQYIFAASDPGKIANGKKTLIHAFIGLAIVMSTYIIMSTIRFVLLGSKGNLANCATNECIDANTLVTSAIQWFIGIAGVIAAIFVVYGGIAYVTSAGDPSKLQKAKQIIIYALIGLAIVGLAEVITAFVSNMIRNADNSVSTKHTQTITKEIS